MMNLRYPDEVVIFGAKDQLSRSLGLEMGEPEIRVAPSVCALACITTCEIFYVYDLLFF